MKTKHTNPTHQNIIEALEPRIAPASVFTYTDVDGDHVKIIASKGNLTGHVTLVTNGGPANQGYVSLLDLTDPSFQGANITFKVTRSHSGGDGFTNVGFIDAHGVNLGNVVVPGDLGGINAGNGNTAKPAIHSLHVRSMGIYGVNTPGGAGGGGTSTGGVDVSGLLNTVSQLIDTTGKTVTGVLGTVLDDVNALLKGGVSDPGLARLLTALQSDITNLAGLGSGAINQLSPAVTTLLSNIGSDASNLLNQFGTTLNGLNPTLSSLLNTVGTDVNTIVHSLTSPLGLGGTVGDALSAVNATLNNVLGLLNNGITTAVPQNLLTSLNNALSAVTSSGSGLGGLGNLLGSLLNLGNNTIQTLVGQVSTDVTSLLGNATSVPLSSLVTELSSLQGNLNTALGGTLTPTVQGLLNNVQTAVNSILALPQSVLTTTAGDLQSALSTLTNATLPSGLPQTISGLVGNVENLLTGIGNSLNSVLSSGGTVATSTLRDLSVLESNIAGLLGNAGSQLGTPVVNTLNTVLNDVTGLLGSVLSPSGGGGGGGGGTGGSTSSMATASNINGNLGSLVVTNDLSNIFLNVAGGIKTLRIGGSLIGGTSTNSGEIFTTGDINVAHIGKNVLGGLNLNSGSIVTNGRVVSFSTGGSVIGGSGNGTGELLMHSDAKTVSIHGDLVGNSGLFSASIDNTNGRIATVNISGSLIAGTNTDSGSIRVTGDIHSLHIRGNVIGDATHSVEISAAATMSPTDKTDSAFGSINIGGRVAFANLLGGYNTDLDAVNGHAQIGVVNVKGDWIASNLIAGSKTTQSTPEDFGTVTDTVISGAGPAAVIAKIASIRIGGTVMGTGSDATDHFGFEAQQIGKFHFGKTTIHLNTGAGNDGDILSQQTGGDVSLHEIGAALT